MSGQLIKPIKKELLGQGKLVAKGVGLQLLKGKLLFVDAKKVAVEQETYTQLEQIGYDKRGGAFGLPVWDTVTLISPTYTDAVSGATVPSQRFTLDIALVEVTNDRNIVKTKVAGRNGTVKEYMSDGDDDISIRGSVASDYANLPPIEAIKALHFMGSCPVALTVESNFLNLLGIYEIVIEMPKIKQREGARNIVDFEIQACSDVPFDLEA